MDGRKKQEKITVPIRNVLWQLNEQNRIIQCVAVNYGWDYDIQTLNRCVESENNQCLE